MSGISRKSRMFNYLNSEVTAELNTGRKIKGTFVAFDKYLNIVLRNAVESRTKKTKSGEEEAVRELGFILLRGESIVGVTVDGPLGKAPPSQQAKKATCRLPGEGSGRAAGRAVPMQPPRAGRSAGRGLPPPLSAPPAPTHPSMPLPPGMQPPPGMPLPPGMQPPPGMPLPPGMQPPPGMPFPPGMQPPPGMPLPPGMQPPPGMPVPPGFQPPPQQ